MTEEQVPMIDGDGRTTSMPKLHSATHINGTDDMAEATPITKGLMCATDKDKLNGVEAGADVTGNNPPQAHASTHSTGQPDAIDPSEINAAKLDFGDVGYQIIRGRQKFVGLHDATETTITGTGRLGLGGVVDTDSYCLRAGKPVHFKDDVDMDAGKTIDGRDVSVDGDKLDGIDDGADVTGSNEAGSVEGTNVKSTGEDGSKVLTSDGADGATWEDAPGGVSDHANLTNVTKDQHHDEDHASRHSENGDDEILIENLGTGSAVLNEIAVSDGAGGLSMGLRYATSFINVFRTAGVIFNNNASGFCHIGGAGAITSTEEFAQLKAIKSKMVSIEGYCSGGSGTFTLRKNGADTTLTGTVDAVGRFDITGDVDFADGDLISLAYTSGVNWTIYGIQLKLKSEVN